MEANFQEFVIKAMHHRGISLNILSYYFLLSFALVKVFAALQEQERQQYREMMKIFIKMSRNTK